ncbi:MAG: radical SAM protein [Candidatus Omnitrophica bacterium]|nr:radical SAM protein [Candidatus Omnitrophota bacterium]
MSDLPRLVVSDSKGNIFVHPKLVMLAFDGKAMRLPREEELIVLPRASKLFFMVGHISFGYSPVQGEAVAVADYKGRLVYPLSAFLIPGFTRLLHPAARKIDLKTVLPLWAYAAVGFRQGRFITSAIKIDRRSRQRPSYYKDRALLGRKARNMVKKHRKNRLIRHLFNCALNYNCLAAQNFFFGRWEAPLPVAPSCNARCLGCLSLQASSCPVASHSRITFVPSPQEVEEVALIHIRNAKEPIVSFGQGCEGEPLLEFKTLREAILGIRKNTDKGTIHLNTNAYSPEKIKQLKEAGLDSIRISLNSLKPALYDAYFRPKGYGLKEVISSIKTAKKSGLFVAVNLLVFPGVTDTEEEVDHLSDFLNKGYVDMIQWRNLCIDSDYLLKNIPGQNLNPLGVYGMIKRIREKNPRIIFGYFNLPKNMFKKGYSVI